MIGSGSIFEQPNPFEYSHRRMGRIPPLAYLNQLSKRTTSQIFCSRAWARVWRIAEPRAALESRARACGSRRLYAFGQYHRET